MKKVLAIFTAAILTLGLTACGAKTDAPISDTPAPSSQVASTDPVQSDVPDTDVSSDTAAGDVSSKQEKPASSKPAAPSSSKPQTPASSKQQTPSKVETPTKNEFFNDNNNYYDVNAVSIRPRHVYWENGKLVAQCFVINGYNHPVYNLNVKGLVFSNGSVEIADGGFGYLSSNGQNISIGAHQHVLWTFTFSGNAITTANADLSHLVCDSNVNFAH